MSSSAKKVTELAEGILLFTTDHYSSTSSSTSGLAQRTSPTPSISAIEFELEVRKNKLVMFEIDFAGSTNLAPSAVSSSMKLKQCVEPHTRAQVAMVRIIDPNQSWSLETKYTWLEESPGTVQPGQSKQERLADGLMLTTTRTAEMFVFHLAVERSSAVRVTLDCSRSENLQMVLPGGVGAEQPQGNVMSVTLPPQSRSLVCSLQVVDGNLGYKLKTKWSWSETGVVVKAAAVPPLPLPVPVPVLQDENLSIVRKRSEPSPVRRTKPRSSSYKPPPCKTKREEISPYVFLVTEIADLLHVCEITYFLEVDKPTRVKFECDFSASVNLQLVPGGGVRSEAVVVEPGATGGAGGRRKRMQVARLESVDPNLPWKLQCKYKWQEEDVAVAAPVAAVAATSVGGGAGIHDVHALLGSIKLDAYVDLFVGEELTLELLRVMVKDEAEFRRSLELLGVNKMGHRERIIVALKQLPFQSSSSSSGGLAAAAAAAELAVE